MIRSKVVRETYLALNKLAELARVTLCWTKAHVGNAGNEKANTLAKGAAAGEGVLAEVAVPFVHLTNATAEKITDMWNDSWMCYPAARQTKLFFP